jgi:hypothetical protein
MHSKTSREPNDPCGATVKSGAKISGFTGFLYDLATIASHAVAEFHGPIYGSYFGIGEHYYYWNDNGTHKEIKTTGSDDNYCPPPSPPDPVTECENNGGQWNYEQQTCEYYNCPIVINPKSNRYRLTSRNEGVMFDFDADGLPEQLAWTEPDSDVALLVLDRNDNGRIDDGTELFGNSTPKRSGETAANGFDALIDLDGGPTGTNGRIDEFDAVYGRLRLWYDRNHDGQSDPEELVSLAKRGVSAILLGYQPSRRRDENGNRYLFTGRALIMRRGMEISRHIYDVNFAARR